VRAAAAALLAVAALAAGCGGSSGEDGELTVFAAASLSDVLPALEPGATYSFAGSDELAAQIESGVPADVYLAASPKYPEQLEEQGLVEDLRTFATNRLVLIVPKGNPAGVATVADLAAPGVKVVVGADGVPVGDYTRSVLEALGATGVLANVASEEPDVKGVVAKVATGAADAGFVYATDVAAAADDVEAIELPAEAQPPIEYVAAIVSGTEHRAAAETFFAALTGDAGRQALSAAGFGLP
jgi:molybdate transport system substrate-binding protein